MIALDDFTPLQGGVPIELDGNVVGRSASALVSAGQHDYMARP